MLNRDTIRYWLEETDPARLTQLWHQADTIRRTHVGSDVHLRALLEISNECRRHCHYCGLNVTNRTVIRYTLSADMILHLVSLIDSLGFGTVVLQSGEHPALDRDTVAKLIERIKSTTNLAITLSLGERNKEDYRTWKASGADRYLLKFETSNTELYKRVHPATGNDWNNRLEILDFLKDAGYEVGSGFMIGLPGQSYSDIANDIMLCRTLSLDMIAAGPYIPHPATLLGSEGNHTFGDPGQVPASVLMTLKTVALLRLCCPDTNIPATSALSVLDASDGRESGLECGANVFMPDITPMPYRKWYEIYPGKIITDTSLPDLKDIRNALEGIGRTLGKGPGISVHFQKQHAQQIAQ